MIVYMVDVILKGEALLTVSYTIFGNKSYSYKMYA
jgi:hypothetical protein